MRLSALVSLCLLLLGCAPTPQMPVHTVALSNQSAAPALWANNDSVISVWIAQDAAGIRQEARIMRDGALADPVTLPLPPAQPYDPLLLPANDHASHLFWLDLDSQGILHLYAALLGSDLSVERGPLAISDSLTLRYTAIPQPEGGALLLWSGGNVAEPTLYARQINARGLPDDTAILLAYGADWPTAIQANDGTVHVFWLDTATQSPRHGQFDGAQMNTVEPIPNLLRLASGDRLHALAAALDQSHAYLLWSVTRRSGQIESGMVARPLETGIWTTIPRMGLADTDADPPQTGFNTAGTVLPATAGDRWLRWVAPLPGQFETLPVAAQVEEKLALVFLRDGAIIGYQPLVDASGLLRPPNLRTDRDRYLYLSWSDSQEKGPAALKLLSTRP